MSLKVKIMDELKEAMKSKDQVKLTTLRFLNAQIKNKEIDLRPNQISEEEIVSVIKKSVKQRQDSIEQYTNANRQDLADAEIAELKILESYLPQMMSEVEVKAFVLEAIKETGATEAKDMGKVMKAVMAKTKGQADNKVVSELVKQSLA
jgi:uncharacterized protein